MATTRQVEFCGEPGLPILMYHSVADTGPAELAPYRVSRRDFRKQLRFLRRQGYYTVSLDDWARSVSTGRRLPGRPVILTFDDGYEDFFTNAWPALDAEGWRATVFVVTGRVGTDADWHGLTAPLPLMGWDRLRALQAAGNVVGSHCARHRDLTALSDADIADDCAATRRAMLRELGREARSIALPCGVQDARVRLALAENGYAVAVGVEPRLATPADDMMNLPRIEVFGDDDLDAFALKIGADGREGALAPAVEARPEPPRRVLPAAAPARSGPRSRAAGTGSDVAVVVTSCARQDLLQRALDSFFRFNTYPVKQLIVVEDGPGIANDGLQACYAGRDITWIATEERCGQIAAVDHAYALVECEYIFHLEDDWEFTAPGFIEKSLAVLEALPSCIQVWLRALDDTMGRPLSQRTQIVAGIPVKRAAFGCLGVSHGFTFNPGLRRTADYDRLGRYGLHVNFDVPLPYRSEYRLFELYRDLGFYAVALADNGGRGYVRHIGDARRAAATEPTPRAASPRRAMAVNRLRIIVSGWLVRGPTGGMAWHYLNYMQGLRALGHEVFFIEDSDDRPSCFDFSVSLDVPSTDPRRGLHFAACTFERLGFGDRWAYFDAHDGKWKGARAADAQVLCETADLLLNISGIIPLRDWTECIPIRAFIDTDPGFTQTRNLADPAIRAHCAAHNRFFTFGENIGKPSSSVLCDGFDWQSTRQPIALASWPLSRGRRDARLTTVMSWDSFETREFGGQKLAMKSQSFRQFLDLPRRLGDIFEIAVRSNRETAVALRAAGWRLADIDAVTRDPWAYRRFIRGSKAEFGIAKEGYVTTRCGWFSERSAAYLALGRPVMAQDTGFGEWLPSGRGVMPFAGADDLADALDAIDAHYEDHCRGARELAEEYFSADRVLPRLLEAAMSDAPPPRAQPIGGADDGRGGRGDGDAERS